MNQKLKLFKYQDTAINFMQNVIAKNPDDLDACLSINYLLMNLLVEEDYDATKQNFYAALLKKYFDISYAKFADNPEYLYYMGRIAAMSEWYVGLDIEDVQEMLQKAAFLDPENPVYQWVYYGNFEKDYKKNKDKIVAYAQLIFQENSPIKEILIKKGALGNYILSMMQHWAQGMLNDT